MAGKNVRSCAAAQQQRPTSQEETSASGVSTPPHGSTSLWAWTRHGFGGLEVGTVKFFET